MLNKFNQDFLGFPFDRAHKFASEERIIQNYLMGDSSGIVRNFDQAGVPSATGLEIDIAPFLAVAKGSWFRSMEQIKIPVLPSSSGTIVAQVNLGETNDSVGDISDGSYQYLLNQVQVTNITTAPVKEDILASGVRYDIVIAKWVSSATAVTVTDAREYAASKKSFMAMIGQVRYQMASNAKTKNSNGGRWTLPAGKNYFRASASPYDTTAVKLETSSRNSDVKITNISKHPIFVKHQLAVSVGGNTTSTPYKFNMSSDLTKSAPGSDVNISGGPFEKWEVDGGQLVSSATTSIRLIGSNGFTNFNPTMQEGYTMKPGEVVYWHCSYSPYGNVINDQNMNVEGLMEIYELG